MSGQESDWRLFIPRSIRTLPADILGVLVAVLITTGATLLPVVRDTPLRIVFGLPFLLFVPGYAFIAALFPEAGDSVTDASDTEPDSDAVAASATGIDGLERVALSFGTSIAIVPLVGLVLNFTPWGIRLLPIVISIGGLTVVLAVVAGQRRQALPEADQFAVPYEAWWAALKAEFLAPDTRTDAALNVLVVVSVLLAVGSVGYAVAIPKQGESFTEFYLLTENQNGELTAEAYPTQFTRGESKSLVVGIGNQEHETVRYTMVAELQRVAVQNNSTIVQEATTVSRFQTTLEHNETAQRRVSITPQMTGERLRLVFLLYRGSPPASPSLKNAYRETHLWVNVSAQSQYRLNRAIDHLPPSTLS